MTGRSTRVSHVQVHVCGARSLENSAIDSTAEAGARGAVGRGPGLPSEETRRHCRCLVGRSDVRSAAVGLEGSKKKLRLIRGVLVSACVCGLSTVRLRSNTCPMASSESWVRRDAVYQAGDSLPSRGTSNSFASGNRGTGKGCCQRPGCRPLGPQILVPHVVLTVIAAEMADTDAAVRSPLSAVRTAQIGRCRAPRAPHQNDERRRRPVSPMN